MPFSDYYKLNNTNYVLAVNLSAFYDYFYCSPACQSLINSLDQLPVVCFSN